MAPTNPPTVIGRLFNHFDVHNSSLGIRLGLIVLLFAIASLTIKIVRQVTAWIIHKNNLTRGALQFVTHQPKFITFIQLLASSLTCLIGFLAIGLVLEEMGVNLAGYLASASIVALAISFGSQGLVQDVVIGLTLIFSDTMDAGNLVEVYANTSVIGRVEKIGMRFTVLRNFYNQLVFIPNRNIANVSRFPDEGLYAYADVQLPDGVPHEQVLSKIQNVVKGTWEQFRAIILEEPAIGPIQSTPGEGWHFVRIHFKIWPGQGGLIETIFRQQIIRFMKESQPDYADWQVPVTYRSIQSPDG